MTKTPGYLKYEKVGTDVINATIDQRLDEYPLKVKDLERVFDKDTPFEYLGDYYIYKDYSIPFYVVDFYSFPMHQTMLYPTYIKGEQPKGLEVVYITESCVVCKTDSLIATFKEDAFLRSERLFHDLTDKHLPRSLSTKVDDSIEIIETTKPVKHITERYISSMYKRYATNLGIPEEVSNLSCGYIVQVIGQHLSFLEADNSDRVIDMRVAREVANKFHIEYGSLDLFTDEFILKCLKNYDREDLYKIIQNYKSDKEVTLV